jgi:hypothetical protein
MDLEKKLIPENVAVVPGCILNRIGSWETLLLL